MIKRRLLIITLLTFIGAILFVPFLKENNSDGTNNYTIGTSILFILISSLIAFLTAFGGFKFSDKLNIKSPILGNIEYNIPIDYKQTNKVILNAIIIGIVIATLTILCNVFFHPPINKGSFLTRIATTIWSSVFTETISHLFVLSGLMLLIKNKWLSLIISGLIFVIIFHFSSDYNATTAIYLGLVNFLAISLTGYLFITNGFEVAIITHMIMHFVLLAVNV